MAVCSPSSMLIFGYIHSCLWRFIMIYGNWYIHSCRWILVSTCAALNPGPSPGLDSSLAWDYLHPDSMFTLWWIVMHCDALWCIVLCSGITCTPAGCNVLYCSVLWCIVLCSGITCIQTTIHPFPIHRPAMDPEYLVCWPTPLCWLFDTFSFSKLLECRFRLGVRMRGLFPFWNKWSVVSEWACEPGWQATHFSERDLLV